MKLRKLPKMKSFDDAGDAYGRPAKAVISGAKAGRTRARGFNG
jgi:hypothetical protein